MTAAIFIRALRGRWPLVIIPLSVVIVGRFGDLGAQAPWMGSERQAVVGTFALWVAMPVLALMLGIELVRTPWGSWSWMLGRPASRRRLFATIIAADALTLTLTAAVSGLALGPLPHTWGPLFQTEPAQRTAWLAVILASSYLFGAMTAAGAGSSARAAARTFAIAPLVAVVAGLGAWVGQTVAQIWVFYTPREIEVEQLAWWLMGAPPWRHGVVTFPEQVVLVTVLVGAGIGATLVVRRVPSRCRLRAVVAVVLGAVLVFGAALAFVGTMTYERPNPLRGPYAIQATVVDRAGDPIENANTWIGRAGSRHWAGAQSRSPTGLSRGLWTVCSELHEPPVRQCDWVALSPEQPRAKVTLVLDRQTR